MTPYLELRGTCIVLDTDKVLDFKQSQARTSVQVLKYLSRIMTCHNAPFL